MFAAVADHGDGAGVDSRLERRAVDGTLSELTSGPADVTPAISPDGARIAFARPVMRGVEAAGSAAVTSSSDSELWLMTSTGGDPERVVDLPLTDETGPVWSQDGRYLFATSMLRGADGTPVWASVIYVDLTEQPRADRVRVLVDRAGATARLTPALVSRTLDRDALAHNPEYLPELARIMAGPIAAAKARAEAAPEPR